MNAIVYLTHPKRFCLIYFKEANLQVSNIPFAQMALIAKFIGHEIPLIASLRQQRWMLVKEAFLMTKDRERLAHFDRTID
jgi:predicted membrane-bound spermidine synthase